MTVAIAKPATTAPRFIKVPAIKRPSCIRFKG